MYLSLYSNIIFQIAKAKSTYSNKKDTPTPTNHLLSLYEFLLKIKKSGLSYPGSLSRLITVKTWCSFSMLWNYPSINTPPIKSKAIIFFHTLPNMLISFSKCASWDYWKSGILLFYFQDPRTLIAPGQQQGFIECMHGSRS